MTMDIEKIAKSYKEGSSGEKTHLIASGVGAIIGGVIGGYPGMQIGMSLVGYLFKPDSTKSKDTYNSEYKLSRTKLDSVPDVIGTDISPGKVIYVNKNTLGVYSSDQLPDMDDPVTEAAWQAFINMISNVRVGHYAEFAVNFANQYNGNMHHMGVMKINNKPVWFWTMLSDMFENYDDPFNPYSPITLIDGGQGYWFHEIDVEDYINQPVKNDLIVHWKGFIADFSALSTDPEQSNVMFDFENMEEMNPSEFQMGQLTVFPTFTAEINREDVHMPPESQRGGKGMVTGSWFYWESNPSTRTGLTLGGYFNNLNGKYNKVVGYSNSTIFYPLIADPVESTVEFPASDYSGTQDYPDIVEWLNDNITVGSGTILQSTDVIDDRQYICVFRNWYNPNQGRGVFGVDKVNHHHAEYGVKIDLYYHDMTREDCRVESILYDYEYSDPEGDYNPRFEFGSMRVDDTYVYLFGNRIQTDFVLSDQREIESGANSYTRCYADFSQYPNGYWNGWYAALQQENYWIWATIINQTSTYIDVEHDNSITGGWGKIPVAGEVVKLHRHRQTEAGLAICGEGSTTTLLVTNVPDVPDWCVPAASIWQKAGFVNAGDQKDCTYTDQSDTTIELSSALSRDPVPGEILYFTEPDENFDEDETNPLISTEDDSSDLINMLLDLGFTDINVRWQSISSNEFSFSHKLVLRINKNTGAITEFKNDRVWHPHIYGFYFWTASLSWYTCQTDKQAFVYGLELFHGSNLAANSYIIDFTSGVEEEIYMQNQFSGGHTPLWCYHGCVPIKEWNGTAYEDTWYTLLTTYDSFEGINNSIGQGNHFLKLGQGRFSNRRVISSNTPLYEGLDIDRREIRKLLYRKGVATGPLYGGIYTGSYPNENNYHIAKIEVHNEIYFRIYKGDHATIYPTNELWKFIPPSDTNPAGTLYMLHKTKMEDDNGDVWQWNRMDTSPSFRMVKTGWFSSGFGSGGIWYHCDESPPNIIKEFWNEYKDPRYIPEGYKDWLGITEALSICNEYVPAIIYRSEGEYNITERRFQFSQCYDQPSKMHDVIQDILATCQGFISPCTWDIINSDYYKLIVPNKDEVPVHYFGKDSALLTSNQLSDYKNRIYADFSSYPNNYWKGDEIDFGEVVDHQYPYPDSEINWIIEQTSTYITLAINLTYYWPNAKQFTLVKDNIKEGSFTFSEKSYFNRPNKVRIEFRNRLDNYVKDVAEAEDTYRLDVLGENEKIDFYRMHGIKRATQAGRLALRILDQWNYQKYICGLQTDIMGMHLCMGEIVGISHDITGWNGKWFRITAIEEMMDFEVKIELEEFNSNCYHDSGVPVVNGHAYGGFPAPYVPNQVERFTVYEDIEFNRLYFTFDPPQYDSGFFVGARIYRRVGSEYEYITIVSETVSSVRLAQDVSIDDTTIYYDNNYLSGTFPSEGVIWIEDELIYYHGIDTTNYAFMNCVRGYKDTNIVAHSAEDDIYIKLRSDVTEYFEMPTEWEGTTQTFKAAAFTIQGLTASVDIAPTADIDIVGYGLLPYFPESIHQPVSELPELHYLFESLGLGDSLEEIVQVIETLGLGDTKTGEVIINIFETIGLDDVTIAQATEYLTEALGLGDSATIKEFSLAISEDLGLGDVLSIPEIWEYITETLGLGDTDTIAEMLVAISESLGLGDDLEDVSGETFDYSTNFSEYSTGSPPSDWTEYWHDTAYQLDIVTSPADLGGKSLHFDITTTDQRDAIGWDDVGNVENVEILCKVRWPALSNYMIGPAARVSGGSTDETGYIVFLNDSSNRIELYRYNSGTGAQLDTYNITLAINTWYWLRMTVEAHIIKVRIWADGGSEPGTWHINYEDSSPITGTGAAGLVNYSGDGYCDYFAANVLPITEYITEGLGFADYPYFPDGDLQTDFSEYPTDTTPADWTEYWHTTAFQLNIINGGANKVLYFDLTTTGQRCVATWDDVSTPTDVEILACVMWPAVGTYMIGPALRITGTDTTENGYGLFCKTSELSLFKFTSGSSSADLATFSKAFTYNTWYWIRMRAVDDNIKAKAWTYGDAEPGTWGIDYTDPSPILTSGAVGLLNYSNDAYCDFFQVTILDSEEAAMIILNNNLL